MQWQSAAVWRQQNICKHSAAAVSSTWQWQNWQFSAALGGFTAAVLQHLQGMTPWQCDITVAVWRQFNFSSAAMLQHPKFPLKHWLASIIP
jgi:hypothetical protein